MQIRMRDWHTDQFAYDRDLLTISHDVIYLFIYLFEMHSNHFDSMHAISEISQLDVY